MLDGSTCQEVRGFGKEVPNGASARRDFRGPKRSTMMQDSGNPRMIVYTVQHCGGLIVDGTAGGLSR